MKYSANSRRPEVDWHRKPWQESPGINDFRRCRRGTGPDLTSRYCKPATSDGRVAGGAEANPGEAVAPREDVQPEDATPWPEPGCLHATPDVSVGRLPARRIRYRPSRPRCHWRETLPHVNRVREADAASLSIDASSDPRSRSQIPGAPRAAPLAAASPERPGR